MAPEIATRWKPGCTLTIGNFKKAKNNTGPAKYDKF